MIHLHQQLSLNKGLGWLTNCDTHGIKPTMGVILSCGSLKNSQCIEAPSWHSRVGLVRLKNRCYLQALVYLQSWDEFWVWHSTVIKSSTIFDGIVWYSMVSYATVTLYKQGFGWHSMAFYCFLCYSRVLYAVLWLPMLFNSILCCSMLFYGILDAILWDTVNSVEFNGVPWY